MCLEACTLRPQTINTAAAVRVCAVSVESLIRTAYIMATIQALAAESHNRQGCIIEHIDWNQTHDDELMKFGDTGLN